MNEPAAGAIKVLVKAFDDITGGNSLVVPAEHEQMFTAVFGWWGWINRSCKLSLLAHDAGLGHESTPNLRSIVEHCLVLQWVVGRRLRCDGCRRRPRRTTPTQVVRRVGRGALERAGRPVASRRDKTFATTLRG